MNGLDDIAVFVKVVQAGSFTGAGRLLSMPVTTVSSKVAALEQRLGTTLIQRTTRKLNVTPAGEAYFRRCVVALEEIHAAETELSLTQAAPRGVLRITSAVDVGQTLLPSMVQAFLKKYPDMKVDLLVTNRVVDLVAEGVDLAIRAGALEDSSLIAKRVVSSGMRFLASPAYLKKAGVPNHPRDLEKHQTVRFSAAGPFMEVSRGKEKVKIGQSAAISADDLTTIKNLVLMGAGISPLPTFLCEEEMKKGKLVPILDGWSWGTGHFSVVYPAQKFVAPKIHSFIEVATALGQACQALEGKNEQR